MNKTIKKVLLVAGGIVVLALAVHLTMTYLIPFIAQMHNAPTY